MSKEITLRDFIKKLQDNVTEEQLDMLLQSIGAGNTGYWHIFIGKPSLNDREEIKIPIYKE